MRSWRLLIAFGGVMAGGHELAQPARAESATLFACPVVVTVSECPEEPFFFCMAYDCNTTEHNCSEFGGALRMYCGTPPGGD